MRGGLAAWHQELAGCLPQQGWVTQMLHRGLLRTCLHSLPVWPCTWTLHQLSYIHIHSLLLTPFPLHTPCTAGNCVLGAHQAAAGRGRDCICQG